MKPEFVLLYLLLVLCCCKPESRVPAKMPVNGVWELDSCATRFYPAWYRDRIFITDSGRFWRFSYSTFLTDRYTIDSALVISGDSVRNREQEWYHIRPSDTDKLTLSDGMGNLFFYKRQASNDPDQEDIADMLRNDSVKQSIQGWWRLKSATYKPIEMINANDIENGFTLALGPRGTAVFYVNHIPDSTIEYDWRAIQTGFTLSKGCLSGAALLYRSNGKEMALTMSPNPMDTLTLERIDPIIIPR